MAFEDKQLGSEFLNSFNGILMLAQGMLGMQMAELDNAPSQESIAGFFQGLAMQSDDGGATLRLKLGQEFFGYVEEMGPALEELAAKLGDLTAYHPPEVLENGDIIIRHKKPVEPEKEADPKQEEPGKIIDL